MGRPFGGRATCESYFSIDVRRWHRERKLDAGLSFSCSWTCGGEPSGSIGVRTKVDAVVLMYSARSWRDIEWKSVHQRVPITWTPAVAQHSLPSGRSQPALRRAIQTYR